MSKKEDILQKTIEAQFAEAQKQGWMKFFTKAAQVHGLLVSALLAICSRETGFRNIVGDAGHGRGLMQVDDRSHADWIKANKDGLDPETNIFYGADILSANLEIFAGDYEKAFAAYNCGAGNVKRALRAGESFDSHTTGHDYGKDTHNRMLIFQDLIDGGK